MFSKEKRGVLAAAAVDVIAALLVAVLTHAGARVADHLVGGAGSALTSDANQVLFVGELLVQFAAALFLAVPRLLRGDRARRITVPRALLVLLFAAVMATLALGPSAKALTAGAWISRQSYVGTLRWGFMGLGGAAFAFFMGLWFVWGRFERGGWRAALVALTAAVFGVALFLNTTKYPGQYADAHLLLTAVAAIAGQLAMHEVLRFVVLRDFSATALRWAQKPAVLFGLATVIVLVTGVWLGKGLPLAPKTVSNLLLESPRAAYVLNVVLPPPPRDEIEKRLVALDYKRPYASAGRLRQSRLRVGDDWNVILIVVDTLRADTLPPSRDTYPKHRFDNSTAPFLTSLVNRSYRFSRAYAGGTYTAKSMPSMFRSHWASEDPTTGTAIATVMAEYGRTPIALVNDYFTEPWNRGVRAMSEGFAEIDVYAEKSEGDHLPLIKDAFARHKDHPFFAWIHYYACHAPGWNGQVMSGGGSWPDKYKQAVNWVDGQVEQVFAELEKQGLADHTIVILTADHGEGLMDTGQMSHGTSILEELARVPLSIYIPGRPGALVDRTVGNVDILPTIVELVGGAPRHGQRGESLVPLILDKDAPWTKPYVLVSGTEAHAGVVRGADKHIFDLKTGSHMYFDLSKDPLEDHDAYDPLDPMQSELLGQLVEMAPEHFVSGLKSPSAQKELDLRLSRVDVTRPPEALPFLLNLVKLSPSPSRIAWAESLFEKTTSDGVRLDILERLFAKSPDTFGRLLTKRLRALADTPQEAGFVADVASLRLPAFGGGYITSRFLAVASRTPDDWMPWLRLVSGWTLNDPRQASAMRAILDGLVPAPAAAKAEERGGRPTKPKAKPDTIAPKADEAPLPPDPGALRLVLDTLLRITPSIMAKDDRDAIAARVSTLVDHPTVAVAAGACRALGHVGDRATAEPILRAHLDNYPLLVRLRALEGLVDLVGKEALPEVTRLGRESGFIITAIVLVGQIGDKAGEPFLKWALKEGPGRKMRTRIEVSRARKAIRKHNRAAGKAKSKPKLKAKSAGKSAPSTAPKQ